MEIGKRIRYFRNEKGFTQTVLAQKAYISRAYLASIETDKGIPSISTLQDIAFALSVPLTALLEDKSANPPKEDLELLKRFHSADEKTQTVIRILLEDKQNG